MQNTPRKRSVSQARKLPDDIIAGIAAFDKAHGEGIVRRGNSAQNFKVIPTGCFILDFALCGGWAEGYVSTVYGYHSTAKSTIFLNGVREFQIKNPEQYVVWVDTEGLYDADWARNLGVDLDRLIVSQPEYGELAVDIIEDMIQRESVGLIVLDSIPASVPMKVLENSAEDDTMAALARLMGKLCSKITTRVNKERRKGHQVTIWPINQLRDKVGVIHGSPRHLPGGKQINHIPTTKVWLKLVKEHQTKDEFENDAPDYNEQGFKIEKRKHGASINEGSFELNLNPSDDEVSPGRPRNVDTIVAFAKKMGFITGGGGNFKLLSEKRAGIRNERTGEVRPKDFTSFKKLDDIKKFLRENEEELHTLWRSLIVAQRISKKLPPLPADGYLVSPIGRCVQLSEVEK